MPLLRIVRYKRTPKDNPGSIDKMIYVEGLPGHLIQVNPSANLWEPDPVKAIPDDIRMKFNIFSMEDIPIEERTIKVRKKITLPDGQKIDGEEMNYVVGEGQEDMLPAAVRQKYMAGKTLALRIDCATGNGDRAWRAIERFIDRATPRDLPVPEPAIVGNRMNWTLRSVDVPRVIIKKETPVEAPPSFIPKVMGAECPTCHKQFKDSRGIRFHMKTHKAIAV